MRFVFLFVGVILVVTGILVSQSNMNVRINRQQADAATSKIARNAVGGGVGGLGGIFTVLALVGLVKDSRRSKRNQVLMQTGVAAEGTVTFVDKNYAVLVNKAPIYSIVEYTYQDSAGSQHTRRVNDISSEVVIRKQIQVGAKVAIKYAAQNPAESVLVLS